MRSSAFLYVVGVTIVGIGHAFLSFGPVLRLANSDVVNDCRQQVENRRMLRPLQASRVDRGRIARARGSGGGSSRLNRRMLKETRSGSNNKPGLGVKSPSSVAMASTVTGHECGESYQRLVQRRSSLGGEDASRNSKLAPLIDGLHTHRWSLSEQIDDELAESVVDLKPNGEVVFIEVRGGAADLKSIQGSWFLDTTTNMIRMVVDRTYTGKLMEINVRSHYSGSEHYDDEISNLGVIGGEVCEDNGCDLDDTPLGIFRLAPQIV